MTASGGAKGLRMPQAGHAGHVCSSSVDGRRFCELENDANSRNSSSKPEDGRGPGLLLRRAVWQHRCLITEKTSLAKLKGEARGTSRPRDRIARHRRLRLLRPAGAFSTAVTSAFLIPAVGSAVLNALTKTLETKAYAITDVSVCAVFGV